MRVIHVRASNGVYGAEGVILALAREQRRAGLRASLVCFEDGTRPLSRAAAAAGLPALSIRTSGPLDPSAPLTLGQALAAASPAIVHSHGYKTDVLLAGLRATGLRTTLVATNHLWTAETPRVRLYERLDALALRRFDAVTAVSRAILAETARAGVPHDRLHLVPNAAPEAAPGAPAELPAAAARDGAFRVAFVGRLVPQKGPDALVQAAALLRGERDVHWLVAGDGPLRNELSRRVEALGLRDRVHLLGRRDDVPALLARADLLALPSLREGSPLAVLEAMRAGLPVVASRVGGVPDLVDHDRTGLLVPPGDPGALAAAVRTILADPGRAAAMGRAGADLVLRELTPARIAARYLDVYEAALLRRAPRAESAEVSG